ncbi:putative ABC transporter permease subunit [Cytobacillus purgationiresistens]|uniref:ABC-2 type transport system permease protein n=1 Tax=Cytobacillus purgationiresistens TaxID=863449 RepID=A0ABU0ADC6_9BACI|nr:hypothetical protein [Cytobacillus purgationiresistens]MDQ0268443.1 ABC-2 type transport system permease protein [Cytobacillus purgationiresistens]
MTKKLLKLYLKIAKNEFISLPEGQKIALVFASLAVIFFIGIFSFIVLGISSTLPTDFFNSLFAYALTGVLAFNILFGVPQIFKNLYGASDLAFLFTLPIRTNQLFWVKFIQSLIGLPGLLWIASCVLITVFGVSAQASFLFYPISYITILLITLIGMGVAYLLNLVLIQIIPVNRAKELMTVMTAMAGIIVYVLFQIPNLMQNNIYTDELTVLPEFPSWIPMEWGGRVLSSAIFGTIQILPLSMLILFTVLLLFLSSSLVEKGFRTGWIKMNDGLRNRKKLKSKKNKNRIHSPIVSIGVKEWRAIQRDMREWVTFLPFIFLLVFPVASILNEGKTIDFILSHPNISWMLAQAAFLFMFIFMTAGFTSSSFAREAHAIHLLRILPLSGWQITLGKLWINWLIPVCLLSTLQVIASILLNWNPLATIFGIVIIAIASLGITGIGLWLGAIGAKYDANNPQNRLIGGVSFLLIFLCFSYVIIAMIPTMLVLLPIDSLNLFTDDEFTGLFGLLFTLLKWKAAHSLLFTFIGGFVSVIFSIGIAYFFLLLTVKKINQGINIKFVDKRG